MLLLIILGIVVYVVESLLFDFQVSGFIELLTSIEVSRLTSSSLILMGFFYALLLILKKEKPLRKSYLRQSLFVISLIVILYVYGQQDRFLISTNPIEDLLDFSFIMILVTVLWGLTSFIFRMFGEKFSKLRKPVFLLSRALVLLAVLIPLDLALNYLFLDVVYDLPLYEDYWVLEVPFKILVVLLVNFLDDVIRSKSDATVKSFTVKVKSGNTHRFIELNQIAYFLMKNQINYLHTVTGEKLITDLTLTQLEETLQNHDFFRANRQLLIARKAVESYRSADGKKIELNLSGTENSTSTYYISRLGAPSFRKWISAGLGTIQP